MHVALFIGCVNDVFFPRVGVAAARLLTHLGVRVEFPEDQTCCGQAHWNSGYREEARMLAEQWLRAFEKAPYVVAPTGSCVAMVREYYPAVFADGSDLARRAQELAGRTYELCQFITDVLGAVQLGARYPGTATYHASCHSSRLLGAAESARRLLAAVEGLELQDFPGSHLCCGFGGTFAVKSPEVSVAMADDKLDSFAAAGAELVVSADTSCLLHLMGRARRRGLRLRFAHVAEVLAEGMGLLGADAPAATTGVTTGTVRGAPGGGAPA